MEELKNIAPELSKLKKENAFGTPRGYFDDFPARMQMKLEAEKNVADKQEFKIINLLKPALGLAASFAIIFMLVYIPIKTFIPQEQIIQTTVSNDYNDQFHTILEELDENSFFSLLESNDTEENFSDDDLVAYVSSNFSAYEIFEYTDK
ncbi:hypothetical protein SLH46_08150 [Draconibacterium sp. IB214405]|uniref:hypothetical protein n=1 Tax=Draconibacterium sp. IB214405 TaxID=3097352 RepID=UPI002A0BFC2A|nr:hypothetical protein [Draconibacterium sp. IB214405]MDX8339146.1 hypothetical protein [Draconibacterium sp. IB214405]